MNIFSELFITFFKIGCLAFGGGYAVIALLQKEAVDHKSWITNEELSDIMAIAQTLPGIIYVNSATMIGYRKRGIPGALVATFASIVPTFILILLVTLVFWQYTDMPVIGKMFTGVLLGVTALILYSIRNIWKSAVKSRGDILLVLLSSSLLLFTEINVVLIILLTAILGFGKNICAFRKREEMKNESA